MKLSLQFFAALALIFVSRFAFAYPGIHDYAKLSGQAIEANGKAHAFSVEMEITGFDQASGTYKEKMTSTLDGKASVEESTAKADETFNAQAAQEFLANCAKHGGNLEDIEVPAGKFHSCALPAQDQQSSGVYWITDVPFGLAKMQSEQNDKSYKISVQLESFRLGQ